MTANADTATVTAALTRHYEQCLAEHGPTPAGMDWGTDVERLERRFETMARAIGLCDGAARVSVLDAGCGCGLFLDFLERRYPARATYAGIDASSAMIDAARARHPGTTWHVGDVAGDAALPPAEWIVANGLLTERLDATDDAIDVFMRRVLARMFEACSRGIVFNLLSSHVNFRTPRLHYRDPGEILALVARDLTRHVVVYHDLPGYDYFVCATREPWRAARGESDD